jgi:hypothetical protein
MNRMLGKRRPRGQQNSPRGYPALPVRAAGQEKAGRRADSQQRHCLSIDGHGRAITSTIRGVPSEVVLSEEDGMKTPCAVNLHNAVTVSQHRLGKRVAQLNSLRMNEICAALRFSLGCDLS